MDEYVLTNKDGSCGQFVKADSISANVGGVLFFHRQTAILKETEIIAIVPPDEWSGVRLSSLDFGPVPSMKRPSDLPTSIGIVDCPVSRG